MVKEINDELFAKSIENGVALVDFWASWCGPCKMIAPVIEDLSAEMDGKVNFYKVNVDDNPASSQKYRIASIPTLLVFKNGEVVETLVGFRPKEQIKNVIEKYV